MGKPLLLIEAATSYQPDSEDRLTELFASTLDSHPGFCEQFCASLALPKAARHEIETQYRRVPTCRPDMRVVGIGDNDERLFVIYSEHKIEGYGFETTQVVRERALLDAEPGDNNRLMCVVPESARLKLDADGQGFDRVYTWHDIAELVHDTGAGWPQPWGGPNWWRLALEPEAPACQRLLAEFSAYLNEEEVLEAINTEDLRAFHLAEDAQAKMDELLVVASQSAAPYKPVTGSRGGVVGEDESETGVGLLWIDFETVPEHWISRSPQASLSVALATADAGTAARSSEPTVYAGIYFGRSESTDAAQSDASWMAAASDANLAPLPYRYGLWLCRSAEVETIITQKRTLRDQGVALGAWITEALAAAANLAAPRAAESEKPSRSRR